MSDETQMTPEELLEQAKAKNQELEAKVKELEETLAKKNSYIKGLNTKLKKAGVDKPTGFVEH